MLIMPAITLAAAAVTLTPIALDVIEEVLRRRSAASLMPSERDFAAKELQRRAEEATRAAHARFDAADKNTTGEG